jgi:hypothetical protein
VSLPADTVTELRLAGIDPDRLVDRRSSRSGPVVDIAARRRQLLDQAAAAYVLAERHVASADPFVDDQLERSHVRLQHDHPFFFSANHPIQEVTR